MPVEATENEIRVRVESPGRFDRDSFRRIALSASRGIYAIVGRPKGSAKTRVQSLRFLKDKGWDKKEAREWAVNHGYSPKSLDEHENTYMLSIVEGPSFEDEMWMSWNEEKDLEPKDVTFKLMGPILSFEREYEDTEEIQVEDIERMNDEFSLEEIKQHKGFRIRGLANVACNEDGTPHVDRDHEIVEWQALADAIKEYMDNPVLRLMHFRPCGIVLEAEMDHMGLVVEAMVGRRFHELHMDIEDGIFSSFSIGFRAKEINEFCISEGECYRAFTKLELLEISIVDIPANALSRFSPTKVYITGIDYTPTELVDNYVPLRGVKYLKWAGTGLASEGDELSEPPELPPNSPITHTLTLDPALPQPGGGEIIEDKNTEGANMDEDETNPELAKALKELEESEERLKVYEEKERLEAEEKAFNERVQASVEAALEGKVPENIPTEESMKSMFEDFLAAQDGSRQTYGGDAAPEGKVIKSRDDAFEYLGDKYFSKVRQPGQPKYTVGDIEFELWLENQCVSHGKIKQSDEVIHSVQKGGGIMDPLFCYLVKKLTYAKFLL